VEPNYSPVPQAEVEGVPRPGLLLKNVHTLYRGQFGRWFAITAPTSLLAALVLRTADQRAKTMLGSIPRWQLQWSEIAAATALRFGSFFVSWLLGCFALGAIATVVHGLDDDDGDGVWRHDSHQRARDHFGALLLAAWLTFCAYWAGMAVAGFVEVAAIRVVGWSHFNVAALAGSIVVASVISWLGAAVPLILRGNTGVWLALKRSVELSSGYEGALFLLVLASLAGSYVAWSATYYCFRL